MRLNVFHQQTKNVLKCHSFEVAAKVLKRQKEKVQMALCRTINAFQSCGLYPKLSL